LGWWVKCGHFNITYPSYDKYYVDLKTMAKIIARQNSNIEAAWESRDGFIVHTNRQLASTLGMTIPPLEYHQKYSEQDIEVKVI